MKTSIEPQESGDFARQADLPTRSFARELWEFLRSNRSGG